MYIILYILFVLFSINSLYHLYLKYEDDKNIIRIHMHTGYLESYEQYAIMCII